MRRMSIEFSWRYGVVGVYKDRDAHIFRVYPVPFIRFSFEQVPA